MWRYSRYVPLRLKRFHQSGLTHYITFCCSHRNPGFLSPEAKQVFELALERIRRNYGLRVYAYVVMPEHVHLLVSEPTRSTLDVAIKSLKQGVARRLIAEGETHFWQKRYYDFNIRGAAQFSEKLKYIHRNPVKRGLCASPEDWPCSSFRHHATGEQDTWRSSRRGQRANASEQREVCVRLFLFPTQAKPALEWATRPATRVPALTSPTPQSSPSPP